ncbi:MAG: hypothetical protein ACMUIL_03305 [bacterium]
MSLPLGGLAPTMWMVIGGAILGLLYGLQAGILVIYNLSAFKGWLEVFVDMTWSLLNTVFGFIVGNLVYPFLGDISRSRSRDSGWIVYMPTRSMGFAQTLGTINIGGAGQHERMHLLQARIFGPLYLIIFGVNYVVNFVIQLLWTFTIGGLLWLIKGREKPYFRPSSRSVVSGFFGWIYYANLFELWAYASGNP